MRNVTKKLLATTAVVGGTLAAASWAMAPARSHPRASAFWSIFTKFRYAHRGLHDASRGIPENALRAFEAAIVAGFGVEFDVHLTADNQPVVIHDSNLTRMCGVARMVEDCTLEELRQYKLYDTDQGIPTLAEVLNLFKQAYEQMNQNELPPLIIELKTGGKPCIKLVDETKKLVSAAELPFCIESFDPVTLFYVRHTWPEAIRVQLAENYLKDMGTSHLGLGPRVTGTLLFSNMMSRPDAVSYRYEDVFGAAPTWSRKVLKTPYITWTVRSLDDMEHSEAMGAPVIFEGFVPSPHSTIE